jgi:hypothetical protein
MAGVGHVHRLFVAAPTPSNVETAARQSSTSVGALDRRVRSRLNTLVSTMRSGSANGMSRSRPPLVRGYGHVHRDAVGNVAAAAA